MAYLSTQSVISGFLSCLLRFEGLWRLPAPSSPASHLTYRAGRTACTAGNLSPPGPRCTAGDPSLPGPISVILSRPPKVNSDGRFFISELIRSGIRSGSRRIPHLWPFMLQTKVNSKCKIRFEKLIRQRLEAILPAVVSTQPLDFLLLS